MMRINYEYGALDTSESIPQQVTATSKGSSLRGRVEEEGQCNTPFPFHIPVKSSQTDAQNPIPSTLSTPIKSSSLNIEAPQRENTPLTLPTLPSFVDNDDSLDSDVFQPPRFIFPQDAEDFRQSDSYVFPRPRYIDTQDAEHVRVSINFQNTQPHISPRKTTTLMKNKAEVLLQTFGPKLVLEVMGGAGAVWGFSESLGLRTSQTAWFWRPITLLTGAFFFNRWYRQLQEFRKLYDRRVKEEDEMIALLLQETA
ncbi:MAG: hypothetical protein SGBAC_013412 [Bacillariaceae sp.]